MKQLHKMQSRKQTLLEAIVDRIAQSPSLKRFADELAERHDEIDLRDLSINIIYDKKDSKEYTWVKSPDGTAEVERYPEFEPKEELHLQKEPSKFRKNIWELYKDLWDEE